MAPSIASILLYLCDNTPPDYDIATSARGIAIMSCKTWLRLERGSKLAKLEVKRWLKSKLSLEWGWLCALFKLVPAVSWVKLVKAGYN